jgi:hypothetical protein
MRFMRCSREAGAMSIWRKKRDGLKSQRAKLSDEYDKNPHDLRLAMKIKAIDDEIAVCTEHITQERKDNPLR